MRQNDIQILKALQQVFDTSKYGLGRTKYLEIRKGLGLIRTREQGHTVLTIKDTVSKLRKTYPNAGSRDMLSLLFHEHGLSVPRRVVIEYFNTYKPDLVQARRANRLRRRHFWAAGVNDIWAVDQHDKWLRFGLALHTGIEPFSGHILWMKVWHNNRNPQLILSYYLETVEMFGFIPMVTQSDPGTENVGIANAQTMLRQLHDPKLKGYVQHRWMRLKKNITPEIAWSQLRRRFTPGFEDLLERGVRAGWYDPDNTLQSMVFRWVFIPWLQQELDNYVLRINRSRKRRDRNKILPNGVPELIHEAAQNFDALDFKVTVNKTAVDYIRQLYIKSDHVVFDLVPSTLDTIIEDTYSKIGSPTVTRDSVWVVYRMLLSALQRYTGVETIISGTQEPSMDDHIELIPHLEPLPDNENGSGYMGGVGNGLGLQQEDHDALDALDSEGEEDTLDNVDLHLPIPVGGVDDGSDDSDAGWDDDL